MLKLTLTHLQSFPYSMEQFVEQHYKWIYSKEDSTNIREIVSSDLYSVYDKITDFGEVNVLDLLYSSGDYEGSYRCLIYGTTESGESVYKVCYIVLLYL